MRGVSAPDDERRARVMRLAEERLPGRRGAPTAIVRVAASRSCFRVIAKAGRRLTSRRCVRQPRGRHKFARSTERLAAQLAPHGPPDMSEARS
jgi:hypothetical protein